MLYFSLKTSKTAKLFVFIEEKIEREAIVNPLIYIVYITMFT